VQKGTGEGGSRLIQPNTENHYDVTAADLPLSCPMPGMEQWSSHPKVFLPIDADSPAKCSYCGATFSLKKAAVGA
jgi:uncharacterized Zn-finger protein